MPIGSQVVADVVAEISAGAVDPQHVARVVGAFMQRQPLVGHYVQAHQRELGLEGVVLTLLHASVLDRCVEHARGRRTPPLKAPDLDRAARSPGAAPAALAAEEPELMGYLDGNVSADDPTLGGQHREVALGLLRTIARALLDGSGR